MGRYLNRLHSNSVKHVNVLPMYAEKAQTLSLILLNGLSAAFEVSHRVYNLDHQKLASRDGQDKVRVERTKEIPS